MVRALAFRLVSHTRLVDTPAIAREGAVTGPFFTTALTILAQLNDQITNIYFSHSDSPR